VWLFKNNPIPIIFVHLAIVKRILAFSLAMVFLASSVGFTMNTHFCGGIAVQSTLSLGHEHLDCGMNMQPKACEKSESNMLKVSKNQCCDNQHLLLQIDDEVEIQQPSFSLNPIFFAAFVTSFVLEADYSQQSIVTFSDYTPPIPDKDILVLYRTLLI
jgi:hypothetical protein